MGFQFGETFLYPLDSLATPHLWVICTDPSIDDQFAVVNITTLRGAADRTVILQKDEHPFIEHQSCVNYHAAEILTSEKLAERFASGAAKGHAQMRTSLVNEIVSGFAASDHTKKRVHELVRERKLPPQVKKASV